MDNKIKHYRDLAIEFSTTDISLTKMASREKTSRQTLAKYFKMLGFEIINKQNKPKFNYNVFDSIDTEEKAYWLGFIFADGYISSNPIREDIKKSRYILEISLKASDYQHLLKFNKFIEHQKNNVIISNSKCGNVISERCRTIVCNKHLWETLNSYGCTPRKSLTLKFPDINVFKHKDLIRHFIRGYFDGDGCFTKKIGTYIVSPKIGLLGTKQFLDEVIKQSKITAEFKHDKRHSDDTWGLDYNKENGILFINYLYNNATIYLDRKFKLYEIFKHGSRSVKEFTELLSGNIGESPEMDNTEINLESNTSKSSYSVDLETQNENIIDPRVSDIQTDNAEDENVRGTGLE